jgi:hypothetical protein
LKACPILRALSEAQRLGEIEHLPVRHDAAAITDEVVVGIGRVVDGLRHVLAAGQVLDSDIPCLV